MWRMLYYSLKNLNYSYFRIILKQLKNKFSSIFSLFFSNPRFYMLVQEKMNSASWLLNNIDSKNGCYVNHYSRTSLLKESLSMALKQFDSTNLFMEFGVCTGFTLNYMSALHPDLKFYGFDSFDGLPEDWRPEYKKGAFKIKIPKVNKNVSLCVGLFDKTLPDFMNCASTNIAFLHIDSDLYSSCKTIFKYCTPKIIPGTIIVFDEFFGYIGWKDGEYKAFEEWVTEFNISYHILGYGNEQLSIMIDSIDKNGLHTIVD